MLRSSNYLRRLGDVVKPIEVYASKSPLWWRHDRFVATTINCMVQMAKGESLLAESNLWFHVPLALNSYRRS